MLAIVSVAVSGHVPTYGSGIDNCYTFPHPHDISQVVYGKGTGGVEVHVKSTTDPFDIPGEEIIDVDFVLRDAYDLSTFSLYIGYARDTCERHDEDGRVTLFVDAVAGVVAACPLRTPS